MSLFPEQERSRNRAYIHWSSQNKLFKTHNKTPVPTPTHTNAHTTANLSHSLESLGALHPFVHIFNTDAAYLGSVRVRAGARAVAGGACDDLVLVTGERFED